MHVFLVIVRKGTEGTCMCHVVQENKKLISKLIYDSLLLSKFSKYREIQ